MNKLDLVKRIFKTQVKRYIPEISLTFIFIIITSITTAATAWLLDPAIKEIFENKNTNMLYIIPIAIIITFIVTTALATAATAWLLDPAIKEIFENKNLKMLYFIPLAIILTFIIKAFSVYGTRIITIKVGIKIIKNMFKEIKLANDLEFKSRINSPTIQINNISIAGK